MCGGGVKWSPFGFALHDTGYSQPQPRMPRLPQEMSVLIEETSRIAGLGSPLMGTGKLIENRCEYCNTLLDPDRKYKTCACCGAGV